MEPPLREDTEKEYITEALKLKQALYLCRSKATKDERFEAAFFEAVRAVIVKVNSDITLSVPEINQRITELLNQSINSDGIFNVIEVGEEVSLFDPEF